jgi:hypothetical protein
MLDSKSALDLAADPVAFKKTKHILRHAYELQDRVLRRIFEPQFVDTDHQLADILTKGLRVAQHKAVLNMLLHARIVPDCAPPDGIARGGGQTTLPTSATTAN